MDDMLELLLLLFFLTDKKMIISLYTRKKFKYETLGKL